MEGVKESIPEIDIIHGDCLNSYNSVACTRNVVLCVCSIGTAFLCMIRVIRLHMQQSQAYHHYTIFYLATISCCIGGINWVLGGIVQLHVTLQFLKLLMFLVLSHFYWVLASRALRCEAAVKRIMYPALAGVMVYYTVTASLAMANMTSAADQCMEPYWLLMSAVEVVLVQFVALAAVYITRRLNEISTLDSVRWAQKRDLWCIVFVFEFSAIFTLIYDSTVQIMGDKEVGCGAIFNYKQSVYSPVFGMFMVIKLLTPIWAMLYAFQPNVVNGDTEQTYPAYSEDGTYGSAYSDDSQYRQLYHPTDMYNSVSSLPDVTPSPGTADPRLGLSNPALMRNSTATLEPISEEGTLGGRKGSAGTLAAARNIPKESGKNKCFSWLRNPSPGKIYL
ncbi:uncharacterized protein [Littorina saxatilis]|uniref:Uncharacterized protein n=1 Tax=Littorina saxatilis TaxID=31220 RepID=A0AAN9GHF1_9CAEN